MVFGLNSEKEWELVNKYPLMWHVRYRHFGMMPIGAAIEIEVYMRDGELISNNFAKLRRILYKTLLPNTAEGRILPKQERLGRREIDDTYPTGLYLQKVLDDHKKEHLEKHGRETPYQLKEGLTKTDEFTDDLARVITIVVKDLKDLSKTPKENLESLVSLCTSFSRISRSYEESSKVYLAA